ncbi:Glutathione hydrolase 1 [Glycine max]|nr:Glutathione hydrolase 1 [Glycine max]
MLLQQTELKQAPSMSRLQKSTGQQQMFHSLHQILSPYMSSVVVSVLLWHVIAVLLVSNLAFASSLEDTNGHPKHKGEVIYAHNGAVATDDRRCSRIGKDVLREGGHAVDAAVASSLCLGVVSPASSGLGGGAFLLLRLNNGVAKAFDMRETAPALASKDMYAGNTTLKAKGGLSVAVPGELAGLHEAWKQHGKLPWKRLVKPAEILARRGFKVSPYLHKQMEETESDILEDKGLRSIFAPNGKLLKIGDICYNKKLAKTLRTISESGPKAFYEGLIGLNLVKDVQNAGGILSMKDLKSYTVKQKEPISNDVLGLKLLGMPPPSGGHPMMLLLNILDQYKLPSGLSGALGFHREIEALKHVFAVRMNLGDPDFVNITGVLSDMLSHRFANVLKNDINDNKTFGPSHYGSRWNQIHDHGTSHLSIIDPERNAISMTSTVNAYFGSKILSPSTGIVLNNEMDDFSMPRNVTKDVPPPAPANFVMPGKRPLSSMSPTIALKDGKLKAVVGASGGAFIIGGTAEVLLNHFVKGMDPFSSVTTPRVYHQAFDSQRKTLSNLYDMDQLRNNVNARSLPGSNALYGSSTVSKEQGPLHRRPDVVKSKQGFPHFRERVWVKKLVHDSRIRFGTWNIGTLTGKSMEIVDVMVRRKINFMCLQETKWTGEKAKELDNSGFKLWYTGQIRSRNGVGIIVDKEWKKDVVDVRRVGDRIIALKLVVGQDTFNVISGYAPQVGLAEHFKVKFWEDLEGVLQDIPQGEKVFLGGDLNGHVGSVARGFEGVHRGFGLGEMNGEGKSILEFSEALDLSIANTWFKKREEHLITYKSGGTCSQIDFFLIRKSDRKYCLNCKVIPGESLTTQHGVLVMDLRIRDRTKRRSPMVAPRIKWWHLKDEKQGIFQQKIWEGWCGQSQGSANDMWNKMYQEIIKVAKETLGESRGFGPRGKESWWWNESVQSKVRVKKECFKEWSRCRNSETWDKYKIARNETKKAVSEVRAQAFDGLYQALGTRDGERSIYRLAKGRERKTRDLDQVSVLRMKKAKS